nr:uncharacterized protein LOC111515236 [Leptinotarsa decemlineata]
MNMFTETAEQKVGQWISKLLEEEHFREFRIEIENNENLGGHLSNIICAKIVGITSDNETKEVSIVAKYNGQNSVKFLTVGFEREIFIYEKLFPVFKKFQHDTNALELLNSFPKCYQTLASEDQSIIVLENLTKNGYQLYNRMKPMDLDHQRFVIKEYAKLHAVSFAMRDQNCDEFQKLSSKLPNVAKLYFQEDSTKKTMMKYSRYARDILIRKNEVKLLEKIESILETGLTEIILNNVLNAKDKYFVLTHGDSWNNNFMFKYKVSLLVKN